MWYIRISYISVDRSFPYCCICYAVVGLQYPHQLGCQMGMLARLLQADGPAAAYFTGQAHKTLDGVNQSSICGATASLRIKVPRENYWKGPTGQWLYRCTSAGLRQFQRTWHGAIRSSGCWGTTSAKVRADGRTEGPRLYHSSLNLLRKQLIRQLIRGIQSVLPIFEEKCITFYASFHFQDRV